MKVERILFPTDFSEGALQALPYAVDLAKKYNAKLYVLHVIFDFAKATGIHVPHMSHDELYKDLNQWAMKEIDTCCIEAIRGLPEVEKVVVKGIPYEEIIKFSDKEKIDIIVIGTYGRSGIERFIFGSIAERVVRRAPCAVMTVRIPEHRRK
ncbi:MAG: universal stress protein [Nitrospiraceae bacterium]|nr:MAG: universal stress protein [Nitrospiraceae bacterium]